MEQINTGSQENTSNKHHIFENDNWDQTIYNAVWHDRKLPPKKAPIATRRDYKNAA